MKKTNISATIDTKLFTVIERIRKPEKEDRTFSKMVEVLIKEALLARGINVNGSTK